METTNFSNSVDSVVVLDTTNNVDNNNNNVNGHENMINILNGNHNESIEDNFVIKQSRKKRLRNLKKKYKTKSNNKNDNHKQSQKQNQLSLKQKKQLLDNNNAKINKMIENKNVTTSNKKYNLKINHLKQDTPNQTYRWNEIVKQQVNPKNENINFETQNSNYNENEGDELIQQTLFDSLTQQHTTANIDGDVNTNINQTNADIDTIGSVNTSIDGYIDTVTNVDNNDASANGNNTSYTIEKDNEANENKKMTNNHCNELDNDYLISLVLQQEEFDISRKIKYSNGKHAKVNIISAADVNNHYDYKDDNDNDNNIDNDDYELTSATPKYFSNLNSNHVFSSGTLLRHDKKIWNKKHIDRLNEYEILGNLDENDMHFNNQCYNSLRAALDRKGFKLEN